MDQLYQNKALVEIYDTLNAARDDFDFYLAQLPDPPCRVLDIGCGTGHFAIELAAAGYQTTGLDPAARMIAAARAKPGAKPVAWATGLVSDLPPDDQFDVAIMTGHAFQCLLDDETILGLFHDVRSRLTPNGTFWFETRNPTAQAWTRWTPEHSGPPIDLENGRSVRVIRDVLNVKGERVAFSETYILSDRQKAILSESTLRFASFATIKHLANAAGFRVASVAGDWNGAMLGTESPEIILQLAKTEAL
ncbi:MAG: class I SAM-dependent methyltransferase [Pseudomonadota bacterium]